MNSRIEVFSPFSSRLSILTIAALRCIFFGLFIFALDSSVRLGASPYAATCGAVTGIAIASRLVFTNLRSRGFVVLLVSIYLLFQFIVSCLNLIPPGWYGNVFSVYTATTHAQVVLVAALIAAGSTWAFWRTPHAVTIEVLALAGFAIYLVSDYRNFNFKVSQTIGTFAWLIGVNHLTALVIVGLIIVVGIFCYLYSSTIPGRPNAQFQGRGTKKSVGQKRLVAGGIFAIALSAFLYIVCQANFQFFQKASESLTSNGVGQTNAEKMSPLGFHSALGGTNQPSGLVRLEGDYSQNPYAPMLYLREAALSEFNGRELVVADSRYDTDVNRTRPDEAFVGQEDTDLLSRTPLVQSIYLLSDHSTAFAIDYPVSINQLKNPNPGKFKASYRAYSVAPGFSLKDLSGQSMGDHRWTDETFKHYLVPHPDIRYQELAKKITEGIEDPLDRAFAITDYFSQTAIYTLSPGHEVGPQEDPVAPFVFGDNRGYCVHFAHATVYLMRALGIPARIGTGYLTDLSQSKDGHILLRMSDRHAWAEAYIDGRGWMPFDTKPEQVESHAETPVDMKMLEELMDMLGPGEEILPGDITKDEPRAAIEPVIQLPDPRLVLYFLALWVCIFVVIKVYLFFGWVLPGTLKSQLNRSYVALLSRLHDMGIRRRKGETRLEFRNRVQKELGNNILTHTHLINNVAYAPSGLKSISPALIKEERKVGLQAWNKLSWWQKVKASFSPASVTYIFFGNKW